MPDHTLQNVTDQPDQVARARRAPGAEAVLADAGFTLAGFVRVRLRDTEEAPHPGLADKVTAVWRSEDGTTVASVDRRYGVETVDLVSLATTADQLTTVWASAPDVPFDDWRRHDPAGPAPRLTLWERLVRTEATPALEDRWLHLPTAGIHRQRCDDRPLSDALAAHADGRLTLGSLRWLPLPLDAPAALAARAAHTSFNAGAQFLPYALPFTGWMLAAITTTAGVVLPAIGDDAPAASAASLGFGAGYALLSAWWTFRGLGRLLLVGLAAFGLAVLAGSVPTPATLDAAGWALGGLLAGAAAASAAHAVATRRPSTHTADPDGFDPDRILSTYGSRRTTLLADPDAPDPHGLRARGFVHLGAMDDVEAPDTQAPDPVDAHAWTPLPHRADWWRSPDGHTLLVARAHRDTPSVSLLSVTTDGRVLETRSLPEPGDRWTRPSHPLDAAAWRDHQRRGTPIALGLGSHEAAGLEVRHVDGIPAAIDAHVAWVGPQTTVDPPDPAALEDVVAHRRPDALAASARPLTPRAWVAFSACGVCASLLALWLADALSGPALMGALFAALLGPLYGPTILDGPSTRRLPPAP